MQTRLLLCFCVFGIVLAEDDRPSRQIRFRITQNGTTYSQPEVSIRPRKISRVFPNAKSFTKNLSVISARENLITEPIVVSDSIPVEGKDEVSIPAPETFLSNDTESTSKSSSSMQIVDSNEAIPVPVLVKAPPNVSRVFTNAKYFRRKTSVTSDREDLTTEAIVMIDSTSVEGKDDVPIPVPVTFSSNDTESTSQSTSLNSVQIVDPNKAIPIPVLVKAPPNAFRPVAANLRPYVPSTEEKEPTPDLDNLENPFSVMSSSFRLWPKLPEPVPVPVLAPKSFAKDFHEKSSAYVGPQYHPKPFLPGASGYQQNLVSVQYPVNSQPQVQPGQPPNQGPIYLIIPGSNNAQPNPGSYQAPSQTPLPLQPQAGNQNYFILQSPFGANPQSPVPYVSQNNGYSSNQGYSVNQQNQQSASSSNNTLLASPNNLGGQQVQSGQQAQLGQQAPLTFLLLGPSNGVGYQSQPVDQQASLKYALFGSAGNQVNLGGQAPAAGFSSNTPQNIPGNIANSANPAGQTLLDFALLAPSNLPANSQGGQAPINYAVLGAPNPPGNQAQVVSQSPQNFAFSSAQAPTQPNSQQMLIASNTRSSFPSSTPSSNTGFSPAQYSFAAQSPSSQYAGLSTPAPIAQPNYYEPTSSPQYFGVSSTQTPPAQPNYYRPTSSPQYFGVSSTPTPSAQLNYYQPTSSPQYFSASSSPAPNYYQSASPSQFTGFPSTPIATAQPNYYQPTSSPQFAGFSSTPAPAAQPNYYQSISAPQYSLSPNAQSNFYQPTLLTPQNFGFSSTPSPTASPSYSSSPTSRVSFSGNVGSYSYFV